MALGSEDMTFGLTAVRMPVYKQYNVCHIALLFIHLPRLVYPRLSSFCFPGLILFLFEFLSTTQVDETEVGKVGLSNNNNTQW